MRVVSCVVHKKLLLLRGYSPVEELVVVSSARESLGCHHHHVVELCLQALSAQVDVVFGGRPSSIEPRVLSLRAGYLRVVRM